MNINVEIKRVYGKDTIYPICINAAIFARIARTCTLTMPVIKLIKELGYHIEVINNTVTEL